MKEDAAAAVADLTLAVASEETTVDARAAEQAAVAALLKETFAEKPELAREDDGILRALTAQWDNEAAVAAKRPRLAEDANDRSLAPHDLKRDSGGRGCLN